MRIYRSIQSDRISQRFLDNLACVKVDQWGNPIRPFQVLTGGYPNTCPPGSTKFYPTLGLKSHGAIDRPCFYAEPGYFDTEANCEWWMYTEKDPDGGIGVNLVSSVPILECPDCHVLHHVKRRYWHLKGAVGWDQKKVRLGEMIFLADSTGASSGHHVHDATKWSDAQGNALHDDNGYFGAFDDSPFRTEKFVLDVIREWKEEEARQAEAKNRLDDAELLREEIRADIRARQLSVLQIAAKWVFFLQEAIRKAVKVGTALFSK